MKSDTFSARTCSSNKTSIRFGSEMKPTSSPSGETTGAPLRWCLVRTFTASSNVSSGRIVTNILLMISRIRGIVATPLWAMFGQRAPALLAVVRRNGSQDEHCAAFVAGLTDSAATNDFDLELFGFRKPDAAPFLGQK